MVAWFCKFKALQGPDNLPNLFTGFYFVAISFNSEQINNSIYLSFFHFVFTQDIFLFMTSLFIFGRNSQSFYLVVNSCGHVGMIR